MRSLHNHGGEKARLLRLRGIVTDPMPATRSFKKALTGFQNGHRLVVHLVQNSTGKHVHRHRSAGVDVWWRTGSWCEGDFEAEDAFVGGVGEFVLVHYLEIGEWRAEGRDLSEYVSLISLGGRSSLDIVDGLFHLGNFRVNHDDFGELCWSIRSE
jgi:hypothetical protein